MTTRRAPFILLAVVYAGFVSLGLPDGTLGVAWPQAYPELNLPIGLAGTLLTTITSLGALSGFLSGRIVGRFGTGPVVLASCALTGSALLLVGRAEGAFALYFAAVPLGLGAGAVDAGLNGFVARHYSGRHMNWLHACWGVGATCGPLVMGASITAGLGWRWGYLALGSAQLALAAVFLGTLNLWKYAPKSHADVGHLDGLPTTAGWSANSAAGWLSAGIFAVYVAGEMTLGLWAGTVLVVAHGHSTQVAATGTALFFAGVTAGRIGVGFAVERMGNRRLVRSGGWLALIGALLFALGGATALAPFAMAILGLGLSPIYPGLMHEVPRRFATEAVQTVIGRQSGAAYLGAALVPAVAGALAATALNLIPWLVAGAVAVLIVCIRILDRRS